MRSIALAIVMMMVGVAATAQEPVPDDAPNASIVEGPISDAIEQRLLQRFEQLQEQKFAGIFEEMRAAREERKGILDSILEIRAERNGLIARMAEMRSSFETWRTECQSIVSRWTPLQNLVERLTQLVWKLFGFVIALCCFVFLLAVLAAVLWRKVNSLPKTIIDAVVKP